MDKIQNLRKDIFEKVKKYYNLVHKDKKTNKINYAGRVFDEKELINLIDSSLEFWLTSGKYTIEFENRLKNFLNVKHCLFVNSGSSANLIAFMSLTSPLLKKRAIKKGDEIITVAAGFPTTISPIIQYGVIPVFVDITIPEYNIDIKKLKKALSKKTKAVFLAHTLGNPFNIEKIKKFCKEHNLWFIEDNCDSLGAQYKLNNKWQYTGTFGDISTLSFYPAHHITTGEGGAVCTNNDLLYKISLSLRDWGRDCWCLPGHDNTCGHRFNGKYGKLPYGYDHKYVYSHFGYNLKATDMQAAIGVAQIEKLKIFIKKRKENWEYLKKNLESLSDYFILPDFDKEKVKPSWFGFMLTIKDKKIKRNDIIKYLENEKIQTRLLFAGNITNQPCFLKLKKNKDFKIIGDLKNTDYVMNNSFWIGVYPGLEKKDLDRIIKTIKNALKRGKK